MRDKADKLVTSNKMAIIAWIFMRIVHKFAPQNCSAWLGRVLLDTDESKVY